MSKLKRMSIGNNPMVYYDTVVYDYNNRICFLSIIDKHDDLKKLKKELRKKNNIASQIIRHTESYVTISSDEKVLFYCSHCWDSEEKLIQLICNENGTFECPHCKMKGIYDLELKKKTAKKQAESIAMVNACLKGKSYWDK